MHVVTESKFGFTMYSNPNSLIEYLLIHVVDVGAVKQGRSQTLAWGASPPN